LHGVFSSTIILINAVKIFFAVKYLKGDTMFELVLHHNYKMGKAFDLAQKGHHGFFAGSVNQTTGYSPGSDAVEFSGGSDQINVAPSPYLTDMLGVKVEAKIFLKQPDPPRRRNIAEGYMAFAFFVEKNNILHGTFYNGSTWIGVKSSHEHAVDGSDHPVPLNEWVTVTFSYNGAGTAKLYINSQLVAINSSLAGIVATVEPQWGLSIGHWPGWGNSGFNCYTFAGSIDELKIWRKDKDFIFETIMGEGEKDLNTYKGWIEFFKTFNDPSINYKCLIHVYEYIVKQLIAQGSNAQGKMMQLERLPDV
jgi:hypothetical protein